MNLSSINRLQRQPSDQFNQFNNKLRQNQEADITISSNFVENIRHHKIFWDQSNRFQIFSEIKEILELIIKLKQQNQNNGTRINSRRKKHKAEKTKNIVSKVKRGGITREADYFHQNSEKQKQPTGENTTDHIK